MYICYGDSITRGVPGVSYIKYLSQDFNVKNQGLGGDTIIGLKKRIYISNNDTDDLYYIIQIGTNDILLPYLKQLSTKWTKQIENIVKSGRIPCKNDKQFKEEYKRLIEQLHTSKIKFKVINIPCIGENIESKLNERVLKYNYIIKDLSEKNKFEYIDYNNWQRKILKNNRSKNNFFISKDPVKMIFDSALTSMLPVSDYLGAKRGLSLTIDGVHLNSLGAKGLASLVKNVCNDFDMD